VTIEVGSSVAVARLLIGLLGIILVDIASTLGAIPGLQAHGVRTTAKPLKPPSELETIDPDDRMHQRVQAGRQAVTKVVAQKSQTSGSAVS
jgi:hypothetical protein